MTRQIPNGVSFTPLFFVLEDATLYDAAVFYTDRKLTLL